MLRSPITNVSTSKYHATAEEIESCERKPTTSVFIQPETNSQYPSYQRSNVGWCDSCNRSYHRSCDDMFQVLTAKHHLQFDKQNPDSLQNVLHLCDLPPDVRSRSKVGVQKLKDQYQDVITATSKCHKLRMNHHKNCSLNTATQKYEPDPGHQQWIKSLEKVRARCIKSLEEARRLDIVAPTPVKQMPSTGKLQSPTKREPLASSASGISRTPIVARRLTFDELSDSVEVDSSLDKKLGFYKQLFK